MQIKTGVFLARARPHVQALASSQVWGLWVFIMSQTTYIVHEIDAP